MSEELKLIKALIDELDYEIKVVTVPVFIARKRKNIKGKVEIYEKKEFEKQYKLVKKNGSGG